MLRSCRNHTFHTYGVKVLCVLCVFSQQQIGRGHLYIEYPESAKSTAIEYTQDEQVVLRVKCECIIFPGKFSCM